MYERLVRQCQIVCCRHTSPHSFTWPLHSRQENMWTHMITCNCRVHVRDWIACKFIEQIVLFENSYSPSKLFRLWIHTQRSHRVSNLDAAPREAVCDGPSWKLSRRVSIAFWGTSLEAQILPLVPSQQLQLHSPPFPLSHRRSAATVPCKSYFNDCKYCKMWKYCTNILHRTL